MARKRERDEGSTSKSETVGSPKGKGKSIAPSKPPENKKGSNLSKKLDNSGVVEPALDPIERRLKNPLALDNYRKFFKTPNYIPERVMVFKGLPREIFDYIHKHRWDKLTYSEPNTQPNISLVREVFALLSVHEDVEAPIRLRHKNLLINASVINAYYNLKDIPLESDFLALLKLREEREGVDTLEAAKSRICPLHNWIYHSKDSTSRKGLSTKGWEPEPRVWFRFIVSRLSPNLHHSEIKPDDLCLLYAILLGFNVDVGRLIFEEMRTFAAGTHTNLPFPTLITELSYDQGFKKLDTDIVPITKQPKGLTTKIAMSREGVGFVPPAPKKATLEELRWRDLFTQNECMRTWFNTMKEGAIADRALQVAFIKHSAPDFDISKYAQYPTAPFEFPPFQHPFPFGPPQNTMAVRSNETTENELHGNESGAVPNNDNMPDGDGGDRIDTLESEDGEAHNDDTMSQ